MSDSPEHCGYLQWKIDGTWTDKRKRSNTLLLDALDRCGLIEQQLLQLLLNNGAAPQLIQGRADEDITRTRASTSRTRTCSRSLPLSRAACARSSQVVLDLLARAVIPDR